MNIHNTCKDRELKKFAELLNDDRGKVKQRLNGYRTGLIRSGVKSPARLERISLLEKFIDTL